ncbi:MAG: nuclease A inhibitor family protein [Cyanobacteria bacterium J06600_6]
MIDNFSDSSDSTTDLKLATQLELAVQDLLWFSEAEYPLKVIYWEDLENFNENYLLQRHNLPETTKVAVQKPDDFFDSVTKLEPWHNETEQLEVEKYQQLVSLLTDNLTDLQVYLLGEIEIELYVLGKTQHQAIAGFTTKIVQT